MGIGIGLGGVARGLESAEQARVAQQDVGLRKQALGMQERALKRQEKNDLLGQADKLIASEMELIGKIIENGHASGADRIQLTQAINPILEDVERLYAGAGRDPTGVRKKVEGLLAFPGAGDPGDTVKRLQADKLTREAGAEQAKVADTAFSAASALDALDTVESIDGADIFLTNPGLISQTRQALSIGKLDPTGILSGLPSQVSGIPQDKLLDALDAAETVGKQRNAMAQNLSGSSQAGAAGLRSQLQARGEAAGLKVQRDMFKQGLKLALESSPEDIDLGEFNRFKDGGVQKASFENKEMLERALREGQLKAGTTVQVSTDAERKFAGRFASQAQFDAAVKDGRVKAGDLVVVDGQLFKATE